MHWIAGMIIDGLVSVGGVSGEFGKRVANGPPQRRRGLVLAVCALVFGIFHPGPATAQIAGHTGDNGPFMLDDVEDVDLLADPQWYQDAPGCGALKIDPDLITTSSDLFRIEAAAAGGGQELTVLAVVRRAQDTESGVWTARILRYEIK